MWILATTALAYETDQLTDRELQLADATEIADQLMDDLLAETVRVINDEHQCNGTDEELRDDLAEHFYTTIARDALALERGLLRAPGYSRYSALLEATDAPRQAYTARGDVFGELGFWESVILHLAGPCSTFEIAGVRLGSDKLDHFLAEGYHYWERSRHGADLDRARRYGTKTERSFYGLLTSKTFSWGDLSANDLGLQFYMELLTERSVLQRDASGCVVQVRPWRWADWVTHDWDEVLNPSVYARPVERGLLEYLDANRDRFCESWERWDPSREHLERMDQLDPHPDYVVGPSPARRDPFRLEELCDPDRVAPLEPWPVRPQQEVRKQRRERRSARRGD